MERAPAKPAPPKLSSWDDIAPEDLKTLVEARVAEARRKANTDAWRARLWGVLPLAVLAAGVSAAVAAFLAVPATAEGGRQVALFTLTGTITAALFAGAVSVAAFIRTPARLKRLEISLAYVERQISDLWGPLFGEIRTGQAYYEELLRRIGRPALRKVEGEVVLRRPDSSLDPFADKKDPAAWSHWKDFAQRFFLRRNKSIRELITGKYELIGPDPFDDIDGFLLHEAEFRVKFDMLSHEGGDHGAELALTYCYPPAFEYHVYHKLMFLTLLQRKYRLQIDVGNRSKEVRRLAIEAAKHRAWAEHPPPRTPPTAESQPAPLLPPSP